MYFVSNPTLGNDPVRPIFCNWVEITSSDCSDLLISIDRHGAQVGKTWAYHPIADAWPMHSDRLGGVKDVFFKVYPP